MDENPQAPGSLFHGRTLVLVPHMDDAVLACGGVLAMLQAKDQVRLVYCTDGRGTMRAEDRAKLLGTDKDIGLIRQSETVAALSTLGYTPEQLVFLSHPEWKLSGDHAALRHELEELVEAFEPETILCPSRYDKHVDHLEVNRVAREIVGTRGTTTALLEFFVYYHWKLLPAGDIRAYVRKEHLEKVGIESVRDLKRKALDQFVSQVTTYYPWQHKPVLSADLLDEFADGPELFMHSHTDLRERDLLTIAPVIVHLLNWLEPILKNSKELVLRILFNLRRRTGSKKT